MPQLLPNSCIWVACGPCWGTDPMHPLTLLGVALGWNYARHRRGLSTMCSCSRHVVGPVLFACLWGVLTGWLIPHYVRGFRDKGDRESWTQGITTG